MKMNERLAAAKTMADLIVLRQEASGHYEASAKTLRKRARIVKRKEKELEPK